MKLLVLGLDSVPPEILFDKMLDKLPNINRLYNAGVHGKLETCHPPITVPAWMVMMTGKNPGRLGIYGFRHKKAGSYNEGYIVNSLNIKEPCVWDILGARGLKSIIIGLPPSYPPKPVNGNLVSCMLTPSLDKQYTYPASLKDEISKAVGEYIFDLKFRIEDREAIKKELFTMTEKRFKTAQYLAKNKEWQLFILHEIGFDRLHHAFWKFFDPGHPKYEQGNQYEGIAEEYYRFVDEKIGELLEAIGDDIATLILSDHGSKAMVGAFCVNQWLEQEGLLRFKTPPKAVMDLEKAEVDWANTTAWAWGGYYARIFINVKGREPQGKVDPKNLQQVKQDLKNRLMQLKDPSGKPMRNMVFEPNEVYGVANGDRPDLMVYFDELNWRSAGTVGHDSLYLSENDTGPDDSVHSMQGILIFHNASKKRGKVLHNARVEDIAPTILHLFDVPVPKDMGGKILDLN